MQNELLAALIALIYAIKEYLDYKRMKHISGKLEEAKEEAKEVKVTTLNSMEKIDQKIEAVQDATDKIKAHSSKQVQETIRAEKEASFMEGKEVGKQENQEKKD